MASRITRLQVIYLVVVFIILFSICKKFYYSWQVANNKEDIVVTQQEPIEVQEYVEKERLENIEEKAKQQIAVSGEKIKLKKQEGFDVKSAIVVLKKAKNSFELSDFEGAIAYARESSDIIDALKLEPSSLVHIVERGDNLWSISKRYYKKGSNWYDIWKINKETIPDFDKIYRGQKIAIPNTSQKNQS